MEKIYSKEHEEEEEALKKRISSHPLYGLLVQTHMECLKIGSIGDVDQNYDSLKMKKKLPIKKPVSNSLTQPELDHFMEAYCMALRELKEGMEEPQHQTVAFIKRMHLQLRDLSPTSPLPPPPPPSGERDN